MTYTTLREAGASVRHRVEFTGNNIYARWHADDYGNHSRYVVYSYGTHFPMYIFDQDTCSWFGNIDKYSSTTSRHQSACHPPEIHHWFDTGMMQKVAMFGYTPVVKARVTGAVSMMGVAQEVAG